MPLSYAVVEMSQLVVEVGVENTVPVATAVAEGEDKEVGERIALAVEQYLLTPVSRRRVPSLSNEWVTTIDEL